MDWFKLIYTLIGGLGLFLFGMKNLSEGLQSLGSGFIRKSIRFITRNRVLAVLVGVIVTCFVQSSSISTVMMTGMVNAGLMNLSQAIGFIFGANIGTTITGWIISIKVGKYGLLLIGFGVFPMFFSKKDIIKNIGKLLFALGLVFFGLQLMGNAFKPLRTNNDFISLLTVFSADSWYSLLACFGVGMGLTMIIQSSSAMLGITIALATQGVISFETAAALVLGENIGTTITIWLASIGAARVTKRVALSHSLFNIFGVLIAFIIFKPYINFIDFLVGGDPAFIAENGTRTYVAIHIATVHTFFNISMTILFMPFLQYLKKLVTMIFPDKAKEIEKFLYFQTPVLISPELAISEAQMILTRMGHIVKKSLEDTKIYLQSTEPIDKLFDKVISDEIIADRMQYEINIFLNGIVQVSLSQKQSQTINNLIRISDELESISDYLQSIVKYQKRIFERDECFSGKVKLELTKYMVKVEDFYKEIFSRFTVFDDSDISGIISKYVTLSDEADLIKEKHLNYLQQEKLNPLFGMTFSDIMIALRRIKNHSLNIAEALVGGKTKH